MECYCNTIVVCRKINNACEALICELRIGDRALAQVIYTPRQNVCGRRERSGARLTHVGNEQGKVVTRRSEGKGKDRELRVSLLRDISGRRPENFKTKSISQRRQEKKSP